MSLPELAWFVTNNSQVTGTTGYIAAHVTDQLLKKGYRVRGTARDPNSDKAVFLKEQFKSYGDKFEIVKAGDLEEEGVFDEAVKGVDGIAHVASPFHFHVKDPYTDLINPALHGTKAILSSAHKYGKNVKHVVVTSSVAAVYGPQKSGHVYTEADWNDDAVEQMEAMKKKGSFEGFNVGTAYRASKNAAERASWAFVESEKPQFGLSTVNPSFVFGPVIHKIKDVDSINTSVSMLFKYFNDPSEIAAPGPTQAYVDVRDVAAVHVAALETPEAVGERFLAVSTPFTWQQVVDILSAQYPDRKQAKGGEGAGEYKTEYSSDSSKSQKMLGIKYISLKDSVIDSVESLKQFW